MVLVFHVILQDRKIKMPCNFMGRIHLKIIHHPPTFSGHRGHERRDIMT